MTGSLLAVRIHTTHRMAAPADLCICHMQVPAHTVYIELKGSLLFGSGDAVENVSVPFLFARARARVCVCV